ncbi:MAG: helix-turn-helix domain-containing protein [Synergistota bacterium]|nr:helix-turn-helix domain-containing protein [Synergistota bacterium]
MASSSDTRDCILTVARKIFALNGYSGASMESIVKGTELSKGAIYWHFKGKRDLFRAVLEKETEAVLANLIPDTSDLERTGALEYFIQWGEQYLEMVAADRELKLIWLSLFLESQRDGDEGRELSVMVSEILENVHRRIHPMLAEIFPQIRDGMGDIPLDHLINIADFFFDALIMNLGVRVYLEDARKYWRFTMTRLVEGGKNYVS